MAGSALVDERQGHISGDDRDRSGRRTFLQEIATSPRHEFWPGNASYHDIPVAGIMGHRQVTDVYLAHLARSYSARLATFDQALAKLHPDVAHLIPTG